MAGYRETFTTRRCALCGALATTMTFEALMNRWHCSDPELCKLIFVYEKMLKDVRSA